MVNVVAATEDSGLEPENSSSEFSEPDSEDSSASILGTGWCGSMFCRRKSLKSILEEALRDQEDGSAKLKLFDLLCIGVGSTIGSGVFVLTGDVLPVAGPSATLSWLMSGMVCMLSGMAYMELSSRLPTKGSCYVFSYHGLGELASVIASVCLTMEYGISAAGVARGWSKRFASIIGQGDASWLFVQYGKEDCYLDFFAGLVTAVCTVVLLMGTGMGKVVINVFTMAKVALVCFLIIAGFSGGTVDIFASGETFFPKTFAGTVEGATLLFFGFIGFDEVCCMAAKADSPSTTMPRALGGTLLGAMLFSGLAQAALATLVPIDPANPQGMPFEEAFAHKGWQFARWLTSVGECVLLPLVVLLSLLPHPEVFAAMAEDGLLPSVFMRKARNGSYFQGTAIVGVIMTFVAFAVPFSVLWDVVSLGVIVGFNLTNASLIMLRYENGGRVRNPAVACSVWTLLASEAAAAYIFWHGFAKQAFAGEAYDPMLLAAALGFMALSAAICLYIRCQHAMLNDRGAKGVFYAWGVPFTPAIAIFVNFVLMAQLTWSSHMFLALAFLLQFFAYIAYTGSRAVKSNNKGSDSA
mmetsp:Transcript_37982/g.114774  ORF Transcript_37982/g.114774 Transcript_37982/m.114774 type:complete len:581 (+) Transcript_37982:85-1827(+)